MSKKPVTQQLMTPFGEKIGEIPHPEYPRPQMQRDSYLNLNGKWQYAVIPTKIKFTGYQGEILVPFSPECLLSGVGLTVTPLDTLYYKRSFTVPDGFIKDRTLLHFTAVDYACKVILNGIDVGEHKGGYVPFTLDVTDKIKSGENEIRVEVTDPTDTYCQARGKQKLEHGGIWYTPQSGIWGTVWMESVPEGYIEDFTLLPDIDKSTLTVKVKTQSNNVNIKALDGENVMAEANGSDEIVLHLKNYTIWSPENPKLYDLEITTDTDTVKSYFGMRKFGVGTDSNGKKRLMLNNKPYFHNGVLDQGYYSDGLLTPPSDEAMLNDLKLIKDMGYNMVRKHIKIEPLRWYYHCDRLGLLVWQDMVNGGDPYSFMVIGAVPFIGIQFKDSDYKRFGRTDENGRKEYTEELKTTVNYLKNTVSIAMWVPFNEGWGQFDSAKATRLLNELDGTRTVDSASGWHDQKCGDVRSLHIYFTPIKVPKDRRVVVLSEFGGYSMPVKGHVFRSDKFFGYRKYYSKGKLQEAFKKLYENRIIPNIEKGLSAAVYTQVSDVEEEINGFITFDRKVTKFDKRFVKAINDRVKIR